MIAECQDADVAVPVDALRCVNRRFEFIARRLRHLFYAIALVSLVSGTLSSMVHANDDEAGLIAGGAIADTEGLVFGITKEIMSGLLVAIPIQAVSAECQRAFALGAQYELAGGSVPPRVLRFLAETRTLFFQHPFANAECAQLRAYLP